MTEINEPDVPFVAHGTSIFKTIINVFKKSNAVGKNMAVDMGRGGKYNARSIEDIIDEIRKDMQDEELFIGEWDIEMTSWAEKRMSGTTERLVQCCNLKITYLIANSEGSYLFLKSVGRGEDSADKAPGKASTYAEKTLLSRLFMLAGKDPDKDPSPDYSPIPERVVVPTATPHGEPIVDDETWQRIIDLDDDQKKVFKSLFLSLDIGEFNRKNMSQQTAEDILRKILGPKPLAAQTVAPEVQGTLSGGSTGEEPFV